MRYRVYHVFSPNNRKGYVLIDMQDLLIELLNSDECFFTIPRKRITFKTIRTLTNLLCSRALKECLDDIKNSKLVIKKYELLPHNSSE